MNENCKIKQHEKFETVKEIKYLNTNNYIILEYNDKTTNCSSIYCEQEVVGNMITTIIAMTDGSVD